MLVVLKRLLTIALAAAFFVGATVQLLPSSTALADISVRADMGAGCDEPKPLCPDHAPNCIDHYGCLTVPALPASPTSLTTPFRWISVAYAFVATPLLGHSIKPELSPPILAA
jgi:hypothetical protein